MLQNGRILDAKCCRLEVLHCSSAVEAEAMNIFCTLPSECTVCKSSVRQEANTTEQQEPDADTESEVVSIIRDCVGKSRLPLDKTCKLVASKFKLQNLCSLDEYFVTKNYASVCFELWFNESTLLCDSINAQSIDECLQGLRTFRSINHHSECVIFESELFQLIIKNVAGNISQDEELQLVEDFKKNLLACLLRKNGRTKLELEFIWALLKYIRSDSNFDNLSERLMLRNFCIGQLTFAKFSKNLRRVLNGELGERVLHRLDLLDGRMTQQSRLTQILSTYTEPPTTSVKKIGDFVFVEVTGSIVHLSVILDQLTFFVKKDLSIQEIRLLIGDTLHVDADILSKHFHGKNFIICTPHLVVSAENHVTIDVSGENCLKSQNPAGQNADGSGKDGLDGLPGESGGNIHIMAAEIMNAANLKLISNGGKGGKGQDGGSGVKGIDGIGMQEQVIKIISAFSWECVRMTSEFQVQK
jgi:golgin subfamily B member 1